jgi:hypothetical protein
LRKKLLRSVYTLKKEKLQDDGKNYTMASFVIGTLHLIWVINSNRMRLMGHLTCIGKLRKAFDTIAGKTQGNRSLERHRNRSEDIIKICIR